MDAVQEQQSCMGGKEEKGPFSKLDHIRDLWGGQGSKQDRRHKLHLHDSFAVFVINSLL